MPAHSTYGWGGGNQAAGNRIACFTIPRVGIGQKIIITAETHRDGQARGVSLFVDDCNNDDNQIGESFTPTELETYVWEEGWKLPAGTIGNGDGTVDIIVYNTNGCHIYNLEVGSGYVQRSTVGYIYNGDCNGEQAFGILNGDAKYEVTPLEATAAFTLDNLTAYDVIIVSASVNNAEAIASLKDIRPFVPMLNLNPDLYTAWGMGTLSDAAPGFADVKFPNNSLFRGVEIIDSDGLLGLPLSNGSYQAVTLAGPFADDIVLATTLDQTATAIHEHNMSHNGYLYIPAIDMAEPTLITNAVSVLANSKSSVGAAPKPAITFEYEDLSTNVSIQSSVPFPVIYYTTDGSEPTEASTLYTGQFSITQEGVTVKAIVKGEGYLFSEVAEKLVDIRHMAPLPTFNMESGDGRTIVTINSELEDAKIYYNYKGDNTQAQSTLYTGPIVCTRGRTIYAFQVCDDYLDSKVASADVHVMNPHVRIDILAHMDSNKEEYYEHTNPDTRNADGNVGYYFPWGNTNDYPYYDPEGDQTVVGSDGVSDSIIHTKLNPEVVVDIENGWSVRSRGQRISWEGANPALNYGDSNSGPFNPETVEDENTYLPVTNYLVDLYDWNTVYPASAKIQTTQAFAGPFDVVAYIVNAKGSPAPRLAIEVAASDADGAEWTQLGDTIDLPSARRLYRMCVRSYEETTPVYVRTRIVNNVARAGILNIYITNEGEESKRIIQEQADGIADVQHHATSLPAGIYSISGTRQSKLCRGLNIIVATDGSVKKILVK